MFSLESSVPNRPMSALGSVVEDVPGACAAQASAGTMKGRAGDGVPIGVGMGSGSLGKAVNFGQAVPVVRRHSYTMGGKPR